MYNSFLNFKNVYLSEFNLIIIDIHYLTRSWKFYILVIIVLKSTLNIFNKYLNF